MIGSVGQIAHRNIVACSQAEVKTFQEHCLKFAVGGRPSPEPEPIALSPATPTPRNTLDNERDFNVALFPAALFEGAAYLC